MKDIKEEIVEQSKAESDKADNVDNAKDKSEEKKSNHPSDVDLLKGMIEKYSLTSIEKKLIIKVISLLETTKTRQMLPTQNVGDSVFKMYDSEKEPTEFVVDRIEFDDLGWKLISYEKIGPCEIDFVFAEKDYNKYFFDTAEQAKAFHDKNKPTKS